MRRMPWFCAILGATAIALSASMARAGSISFAAGAEVSAKLPIAEGVVTETYNVPVAVNTGRNKEVTLASEMPAASLTLASTPLVSDKSPRQVNLSPVGIMVGNAATAIVPEPGTLVLLGLGILGVLFARVRRR